METKHKVALLDALQRDEITLEEFQEAVNSTDEFVVTMDLSGTTKLSFAKLAEMQKQNDRQASRHPLLPKSYWVTMDLER